jgi:hypothetical protein
MGHYYNEKVCPIYTPSISRGVLVGAGFLFWPRYNIFNSICRLLRWVDRGCYLNEENEFF